ncbi:MAG TPA: acylphosphatase [Gemmatimonadaceae bacterium]|nr:acylphosphatase [Gemmatimonadaceae bacterium]
MQDEILSSNATRLVVRGKVQGVGFRWWLRERARELGLRGWVRNLPDGTLEVVAAGPRAAMQRLERLVQSGPPSAVVAEVVREDLTASSELPFPFAIRT